MPIDILMPALSPTMQEGTLAKWHIKEGDTVNAGDVIAEIETDKATMEVEAVDEGVVARILVAEGAEDVAVNSPIAILGEEGETVDVSTPPQTGAIKTADVSTSVAEPATATGVAAAPVGSPVMEVAGEPEMPPGTSMVSMTVREALRDAMAEEMRADDTVFVMGEEVAEYQGAYKVTQGLLDEFGSKRVVDTPITEHGFAGLAVGAAMKGLRPVLEFMTFNFALQAVDHILNSAAKTLYMSGGQIRAPIVFRGPNGAAARVGAQHSQDFAAWYGHIPGLKVISPYSAADAKGLLKSAIRDPNPVVFLENEILYGHSFDVPTLHDYTVPIGKAKIVREGADVTLLAHSMGMEYATKATQELVSQGIDVELIDLRTIRPIDRETVFDSVKKTGRCVTVEEGFPQSSLGNFIAAILMQNVFDYLDAPVINITSKDVPMPYAANLEKLALPSVNEIIEAVKSVTYTR